MSDDVCVIVRECGERTADASVSLAADLLGTDVHRVSGRPFAQTLRASLELGLTVGRPWTLCIDADVLVLPGLLDFLADVRSLPAETFETQALIRDKLLPSCRPAGNHAYRTALLPLALPLISADAQRPEMEMVHAMAARGFAFKQTRHLVGLHDFEQSRADLYGKAYLHAHKHRQFEADCLHIWGRLAEEDQDFVVALMAWRDARTDEITPIVSRDFSDRLLRERPLPVPEKPPLATVTSESVTTLQARAVAPDPRIDGARARIQSAIDAAVFPQTA
jgi:hypothetical protein